MRRSMRLLSMAARAMVSICGDWQPAPAQRPVFCFAWMARRRLRVGRAARGRGVEPGRASTDRWALRIWGQRIEALALPSKRFWHAVA